MLKIIETDGYLQPYANVLRNRFNKYNCVKKRITGGKTLSDWACGHLYYGMHPCDGGYIIREWAPNAKEIYFISELSQWKATELYKFKRIKGTEDWEFFLPADKDNSSLGGRSYHGMLYKLLLQWNTGEGERLPSYVSRVVQDNNTKIFAAQIWDPPSAEKYCWKYQTPKIKDAPLVYEAHIGMAQEEAKIGSYSEFEKNVLPGIKEAGYNTLQLMALMEHPYYGSFGYQVSNFFALSSRFGTPEEFKSLVDACHKEGIRVVMDIVHSHSVKNENEGLSQFDGTSYQYFHSGPKGLHSAWDSRLFDYSKDKVLHFLLSGCAYWLTEYNLDGFRFDGVTSMLYLDHGLEKVFASYDDYFCENFDEDAATYLALANDLIHQLKPDAITISEDMSGYPGVAQKTEDGGLGFDFRLSMGIPDFWIKTIKERSDEAWSAENIWHELGNRRMCEKSIAYCESHDQALVGDKTLAFRLMDAQMYTAMDKKSKNIIIDRGIALHKIIRLLTFSIGGEGYLTFMGNEFGHPEWIDFPREGNNWSCSYARRQWSLLQNEELRYHSLALFDRAMLYSCKEALSKGAAEAVKIDEGCQTICCKRGELIFVVNFSPDRSYVDYDIPVTQGDYELVLNSDSPVFNGFGRVPDNLVLKAGERWGHCCITPYLPSRCALVFRKK